MTTIAVDERTAEALKVLEEQARQARIPLDVYLRELAARPTPASVPPSNPPLTPAEFDRLLDELASGPTSPPLPADFSRADLYADHD